MRDILKICFIAVPMVFISVMVESSNIFDKSKFEWTICGVNPMDYFGRYMTQRGDLNGDGLPDLFIGAHGYDGNFIDSGIMYLFLGKEASDFDQLTPDSADYYINGEAFQDFFGELFTFVGDVNDDGIDDLVTRSFFNDVEAANTGKVYLILGSTQLWDQTELRIDQIASTMFMADQEGEECCTISVKGDIDNDGLNDIILGSVHRNYGDDTERGALCIFFGRTRWNRFYGLEEADIYLMGEREGDLFGDPTIVGDVNNDGTDDLLIGEPGFDLIEMNIGRAYLFFGRSREEWELVQSPLDADVIFTGDIDGTQLGFRYNGNGDVNGDGIPDVMLLGPRRLSQRRLPGGRAFLFFGRENWLSSYSVEEADVIFSDNYDGMNAVWVDIQGDLNGDGINDISMGDPLFVDSELCSTDCGAFFFILGRRQWGDQDFDLRNEADIMIVGDEGDRLSWYFTETVDWNRNGHDEILMYAEMGCDSRGAGKVYIIEPWKFIDSDGDGWTPEDGDCDDLDATVNPSASESCDGIDNNCNGEIDEGCEDDEDYSGIGGCGCSKNENGE